MIRKKAQKIATLVNESVEHSGRITLKFSEGWLDNFTKRWGLSVFRSHGEAGDANEESLTAELPRMQKVISGYNPKVVFNCDECGLFYRMAPDRTISKKRVPGRKKAKERITIMPCANADGSEK